MGGILGKIKQKVQKLSGKTDPDPEAITSAEAEEGSLAQEAPQTEPEAEVARKLVVVGRESVFSEDIIDYAQGRINDIIEALIDAGKDIADFLIDILDKVVGK